jgi:hypothetical protein
MRKLNYKTGILFLIITSIFLSASACGNKDDYSGSYTYSSGPCKSRTVSLKKVQGFGDKYYLVTIYREGKQGGDEFLGSIKGKRIEVENGAVEIKDKSIEVISGSKRCIYILSE